MSILKYIDRVKRMDDLIRRKATGNAEEFAKRLGISRSMLMEHIRDFRDLGAPICFNECRQTYYYEGTFYLFSDQEKRKIAGGQNSFSFFVESSITGLSLYTFTM